MLRPSPTSRLVREDCACCQCNHSWSKFEARRVHNRGILFPYRNPWPLKLCQKVIRHTSKLSGIGNFLLEGPRLIRLGSLVVISISISVKFGVPQTRCQTNRVRASSNMNMAGGKVCLNPFVCFVCPFCTTLPWGWDLFRRQKANKFRKHFGTETISTPPYNRRATHTRQEQSRPSAVARTMNVQHPPSRGIARYDDISFLSSDRNASSGEQIAAKLALRGLEMCMKCVWNVWRQITHVKRVGNV